MGRTTHYSLLIVSIFLLLVLSSCLQQTEKITPIAEPKTLSELQREKYEEILRNSGGGYLSQSTINSIQQSKDRSLFYINVRYNIKDIDVFALAEMPNAFEELGNSFLGVLAKIVLSPTNPRQIDLDDIELEIPDVEIDRSMIDSVRIKKIFLQFSRSVDEGSDFLANFGFIKSLEVSRRVIVPRIGPVDSLMFSYRKIQNKCFNKCIQFEVYTENLLDLAKPKTKIKFKPSLEIEGLPPVTDLKIDGQVELQIGVRLPF